MTGIRWCIIMSAAVVLLAPDVRAQGVAFQPVVGALNEGPTLGVTPSVSFDRRYVRLSLNPQFIGNAGFNTYMVPAAVGGGPGGPGALGGLGVGGGGGQVLAGMDGVIDPEHMAGFGGPPSGYGFMANPAPANVNVNVAPPQAQIGAMPGGPQISRTAPPRSSASKALRRGLNTRGKAKHPATAAPSR